MATSPIRIGDLARRSARRQRAARRRRSSGRAPFLSSCRFARRPARQQATRKYDFRALEKGEGKMFIGMEGTKRDGVRDQRIAKVVELAPPERLLEELPRGEERSKAVVKGREE